MKKRFLKLTSLFLVLVFIFSSVVTYAEPLIENDLSYTINGQIFTEEELISLIQTYADEIYKISVHEDVDAGIYQDEGISMMSIAIPLWAIGEWVLPFIGTVIITPAAIYLAGKIVDASSALYKTILTAVQNISFSNAKVVGPNDKLPNQGNVTDKDHKKTSSVHAGRQGKHVPGHNNNDKGKSQWPKGKNGVKETQEAWNKGRVVKEDGSVKTYDFKRPIGPNGETRVKVHGSKDGLLHGYPVK